jgi:tetratricopeptide (TPR) repeat protein
MSFVELKLFLLQSIQYVTPLVLQSEFKEFYRMKEREVELQNFIVAAFERKDYRTCIEYIDQMKIEIVENNKFKLLKAKCFLYICPDLVKDILDNVLITDPSHPEANFLLAKYLYSQGELSECMKHLDTVPLDVNKVHNFDGVKALRTKAFKLLSAMERGLELHSKRKYVRAYVVFSNALKLIEQQDEKILAVILFNQGSVAMRCRAFRCAMQHFSQALKLNQNQKELIVKLYERRAKCFKELKLYVDCQYDIEKAKKIQDSKALEHMMKVVMKKREKFKYQHQVSIFSE